MADEPEEGFTVRDRRRIHQAEPNTPSAPAAPVTSAPSATATAFASAETAESVLDAAQAEEKDLDGSADVGYETGGGNTIPDIYSVLFEFLQVIRTHAALRLGLLPNPSTGQIEKDLDQARVAIDTVIFLGKQIEAVIAPEERLPLQAMISDLQMQYIRQNKQ